MTILDLKALIAWAEKAPDNDGFWRRLWIASGAYDTRTEINIKALVVNATDDQGFFFSERQDQ